MTLLALQHIACEPPAAFEDELLARGHDLVRVELDEGEPLPDWREFEADRDGRPDGRLRGGRAPVAGRGEARDRRGGPGGSPGLGRSPRRAAARRARWAPPSTRARRRRSAGLPAVYAGGRRRPGVPATPPPASRRSSGTATRSTSPTARRCSPARPPTAARRLCSSAPTASSSTSRYRPSWPRSGARCPPTRPASRRSRAGRAGPARRRGDRARRRHAVAARDLFGRWLEHVVRVPAQTFG